MPDRSASLVIVVGHRRGRPRISDPLTEITIRLPSELHDAISRLAVHRDSSASAVARTVLTEAFAARICPIFRTGKIPPPE